MLRDDCFGKTAFIPQPKKKYTLQIPVMVQCSNDSYLFLKKIKALK